MGRLAVFLLFILQGIFPLAFAQECPELPANLYTLLKSRDADSIANYHSALKHCPGKIASLGNSSVERSYFKKVLSLHQRHLEKKILSQPSDTYLEADLDRYMQISRTLGIHAEVPTGLRDRVAEARRAGAQRENACAFVDNRTPALDVARDQGEVGWCYAYAAADLISHKLGISVSALDIVFTFNQRDSRTQNEKIKNEVQLGQTIKIPNFETSIDGGTISESINYMKDRGICTEKELPSRNHVLSNLKKTLDDIHHLKERMKSEKQDCHYGSYRKSFARFPNLTMAEILNTTAETSHADVLHKLSEKNCKKRVPIEHLEVKYLSAKSDYEAAIVAMNKQLDTGSIVGISYDASMLERGSEGGHGSSIVGRKFNKETGECEYQLRNTWGTVKDKASSLKNDNGYYTVPASSLRQYLMGITYIK